MSDAAQILSDVPQTKPTLLPVVLSSFVFLIIGIVIGFFFADQSNNLADNSASPLPSPASFKIGGILPLTGDSAVYGIPLRQAADLAVDQINAKGGINGKTIEMIWKDGRCSGTDAGNAAQILVEEEKVKALIAGACSSEVLASVPIAQQKKVLSIASSATSPNLSGLGGFFWRTSPSDALAGKVAAQYARSQWNASSAALAAEDKDYPRALADVFAKEFTRLGGKITEQIIFPADTTDFSAYSQTLLSGQPQVIYLLPQSPTPGVLLVKALKEAGAGARLLTAEALIVRDSIQEQGQILEGVTGVEVYFDEKQPKSQAFLNLYRSQYNLEPTYPAYMAGTWDSIFLLKEAFEAGNNDPNLASAYLYNLNDWQGAVGVLNFDENGDPTMAYRIINISQGKANQVSVISPDQ